MKALIQIKLEKAILLRDKAEKHYERKLKIQESNPNAVAIQDLEDSQIELALRNLDVKQYELLLELRDEDLLKLMRI